MNSEQALEILKNEFPKTRIVEVDGNPDVVGSYLFAIDDRVVFVMDNGEVVETHLKVIKG